MCEVDWNGKRFMVGFIYASNVQRNRLSLWESMIDAMRKLCDQTGLFDMGANGNLFTWSDKHSVKTRIWSKLDRILCNESMMDLIRSIHGFFPNPGISDHSPTIVFLGNKPLIRKWFRFQAFWIFTEEFKRCIIQKWQSGAWNLFLLQKSLKALKADLKIAMRDFKGDMNLRVEQSRQSLSEAQSLLSRKLDDVDLRRKETTELLNFGKLLKYQNIFNCQRARLNWDKEGGPEY
ncbi:hypothetical protein QQ045_000172 [Rhodiola kirilowii]